MPNTNPNGLGWTAQQTLPGPNTATDIATTSWAATTAFSLGKVITLSGGDTHQVVTAGTSGASQPTWPTSLVRQDTASMVIGSSTVLDSSILAADLGRAVSGPGIPANSYVGTVTAGVSFVLSSTGGSVTAANSVATTSSTITLAKPTSVTGNTVTDGSVTWQLVGQKFYNAYGTKGADATAPTRFDLTINQKPA